MQSVHRGKEKNYMADFLLCIGKYIVEMVVLAAVGGLGAFIGIKLRRHKDAKVAAVQTDTTKE